MRWSRGARATGRAAADARRGPSTNPPGPRRRRTLQEIGLICGTDKASDHAYLPHYERHLGHLRDAEFTLLEIGIGGYFERGRGGESLRMWKRYFQRATIVGLDLTDKRFLEAPRIHVYEGDQSDAAVLTRIFEDHDPISVLVDDGSHHPEHVRETFRIAFPLLADGGIYVIEDLQTSYWPVWGGSTDRGDPTTSMAMVKDLVDGLNWVEFLDDDYEPSYSDLNVRAVHAYHNLVFIEKGLNHEPTQRDRIGRGGAGTTST